MREQVLIKTKWHEREGGYWEAQAYTTYGHELSGVYATMVDERVAVVQVVERLMSDGVTNILCHSQEPISCQIVWENAQ